MKVLHLSDTHNQHRQLTHLPEADVIAHSGDFTFAGTDEEALDFMNWFCDLPYKHKIFIAGNHDMCLFGTKPEGLPSNVHYLCYSGVEIEGVRFYGIPMFMEDCLSGQYDQALANIPKDTDILVSHNEDSILLEQLPQLHLRYILCGHMHDKYGISKIGQTIIANASVVDNLYNLVNNPLIFKI